eukprot:TRINITY_DN22973_c0_g1_i1.p1 TRINITY_DN22973_c0_g1~~TRINITY_DN22973_c0_g1_i1.p1  ORF type:complete len:828 (+),score=223.52 TRINITY_DN22973_c0_g1_i1:154-2637(+)
MDENEKNVAPQRMSEKTERKTVSFTGPQSGEVAETVAFIPQSSEAAVEAAGSITTTTPASSGAGRRSFSQDSSDASSDDSRTLNDTRSRQIGRLQEELQVINTQKSSLSSYFYSFFRWVADSFTTEEHWIRSSFASCLFGTVILINAIFIGFETNYNRPDVISTEEVEVSEQFWFVTESVFLVIFITELALRFQADGCGMFTDLWNLFDFSIVFLGVCDTWIFKMFYENDAAGDLQTLTAFRLLRLFRIARVLRILRLLRFIRELLLLVQGIIGAMKALGWAFLLITIVLYVSAVFATEVVRDEFDLQGAEGRSSFGFAPNMEKHFDEDIERWFGSVGASLLTLSAMMTLEGWPDVLRKSCIESEKTYLLFIFIPLLCCTNFALLNVVTAVMVEKVFEYAQDEKVEEAKHFHKERFNAIKKISKLFVSLDKDGDGLLTISEMKKSIDSQPLVMKQFQDIGIAKHDIDSLFSCLDIDNNGTLSYIEFIQGCLRMHGQATSKDLLRIQYDVHRTWKALDIRKSTKKLIRAALCLQADAKATAKMRKGDKKKQEKDKAMAMSKAASERQPWDMDSGRGSIEGNGQDAAAVASASMGIAAENPAVVPLLPISPANRGSIILLHPPAEEASKDGQPNARMVAAELISAFKQGKKTGQSPKGSFCSPTHKENVDYTAHLPEEAQQLLANVLQEQRLTRTLLETLGSEVKSLRATAGEILPEVMVSSQPNFCVGAFAAAPPSSMNVPSSVYRALNARHDEAMESSEDSEVSDEDSEEEENEDDLETSESEDDDDSDSESDEASSGLSGSNSSDDQADDEDNDSESLGRDDEPID